MATCTQNWGWIMRIRQQATKCAPTLAIALAPLVIAPPSGEAQAPLALTVVHSFKRGTDAAFPYGNLILDTKGKLYGLAGGKQGAKCPLCGAVYKLDPKTGTVTTLYSFGGRIRGDGDGPQGGLVMDDTGNLYGTTLNGGDFNCGCGTVFTLDPSTGAETVLYRFTNGADGGFPSAGLVRDSTGTFYGTTAYGGNGCPAGCGTVFKVDAAGNETVLYAFSGGTDGNYPNSLVPDVAGSLYGTTLWGGNVTSECIYGCGTVFKLDPTTGRETVLYRFTGGTDGIGPLGGLVSDAEGTLYGVTQEGGGSGYGTVFKLDRTGTEIVLYRFRGGMDGGYPGGGLVLDARDSLYGTTSAFGIGNEGTVFQLNPTGKITVLHGFTISEGGGPAGGLLRDSTVLYGTAEHGGTDGIGIVFRLSR